MNRLVSSCCLAALVVGGRSSAEPQATPALPEAPAVASAEQPPVEAAAETIVEGEEAEAPKTQTLLLNEKHLQLTVPGAWKVVKPRNKLIEMELEILPRNRGEEPAVDPAADESTLPPHGRVTMMAAGGDVDGNIRRWVGQFRLGRDANGKDAMRRDHRRLRGAIAHVLDIGGTYFETPDGPLGTRVERPDYRMLGAIIEVEGAGKYFVKFYGPADIVEENREAFEKMLSSLEIVEPAAEVPAESPAPAAETKES
jgi:hypothetical protein